MKNVDFNVNIYPSVNTYKLYANGVSELEEKNGLRFRKLSYFPANLSDGDVLNLNLRVQNVAQETLSQVMQSLVQDEKRKDLVPKLFVKHVCLYDIHYVNQFKTKSSTGYVKNGIQVNAGDFVIGDDGKPKLRSVITGAKAVLPSSLFNVKTFVDVEYTDDKGTKCKVSMPDMSTATLKPEYLDPHKLVAAISANVEAAARQLTDNMTSRGLWQFEDEVDVVTAEEITAEVEA
jgi:hypothetical protein